jgi:small subunit ribosomal protein S20
MANTSSAKKAERVAVRRRLFNLRAKKQMKDTVKDVMSLVSAGQGKEAAGSLSALYQAIDKAAKKGVIKKNTADRMKSRLTKKVGAGVK